MSKGRAEPAPWLRGHWLWVIIALCGLIVFGVGALRDHRRAAFAYLVAHDYGVSTAQGALIFLMTGHTMHAKWPVLLRRLTEAIAGTLPLLGILFLPNLLWLRTLYPWARLDMMPDGRLRRAILGKVGYLNISGFVGRTIFYFIAWSLVIHLLRRWSTLQDEGEGGRPRAWMTAFSAGLLPLIALTISFAAFDWLMSLSPTWFSSMFPVYSFAGGFVASLALLTILTFFADRSGTIAGINESHYYALGRLLLSFIVFWAYAAFFQFMLIWIANRPEEVTFFVDRARGKFLIESIALVVGHFVVPFFALLSYDIKRRRGPLTLIALWIVVSHYVDVHWLVMPTASLRGPAFGVTDLGAAAMMISIFALSVLRSLRTRAPVPLGDPDLVKARSYESL